jgi:hypothetical protein
MAEVCDCCDGPVVWLLENRTDNWDFYRAYCAGRCESSMRRNPRGATNLATRRVRRGERLS